MATLQKFKLLATQCAVAGSPTRSPTTSPVVHLRRRKTLRMLLSRNAGRRMSRRDSSPDPPGISEDPPRRPKELSASHKLKDLFISSPPLEDRVSEKVRSSVDELPTAESTENSGSGGRRGGPSYIRPLSAAFRQRLLRRAWRPVLVTIPE
ncbi:hypothetical protein AAG906_018378 [Vitis piasezkii]|uniref:uncharacterized protein LOC100254978 n=1 Tax=Vitis vinifera TaxID=29760 RepID=UPI0001984C63|nr:uncharacterized protein LOC100254978 [Vitis vinifera]|eukprot:XP_002284159.1 PREDICTED: uncharacterized protein LOC100254978 [Vitis vinifera]